MSCKECGEDFTSRMSDSKGGFCCLVCSMAYHTKLCPFCGNKPEVIGRQIYCINIECSLWGHVFTLAQWNNRPTEDKLKAANGELKAANDAIKAISKILMKGE